MHHKWSQIRRRCKRKRQIAPRSYKCHHTFILQRPQFRQVVLTMEIRSNVNKINNISTWPNRSLCLKRLVLNKISTYHSQIFRLHKDSTLTPASTRCLQPLLPPLNLITIWIIKEVLARIVSSIFCRKWNRWKLKYSILNLHRNSKMNFLDLNERKVETQPSLKRLRLRQTNQNFGILKNVWTGLRLHMINYRLKLSTKYPNMLQELQIRWSARPRRKFSHF